MKKITYTAPSVRKAFKILHAIAESSTGLGVSELANRLKMGKSTVHGITYALNELGVLLRDPVHKRFTIGYTLLELGRRAYTRIELRDVARIPMETLVEKVGETVFLGIMNGDHVTILDVVESQNEVKITSPPGTKLPLLAGATGRVLLAQMEKEKTKEIVQRMGLVRYTSKSEIDPQKFFKEIEKAKKQGYAVDNEEYILGVRAVAAPLISIPSSPAALWVVGFTSTLDDQKIKTVIREVLGTVEEVNRSLGATSKKGLLA
jgi:IclR family KDG regulon transcriptional repressor